MNILPSFRGAGEAREPGIQMQLSKWSLDSGLALRAPRNDNSLKRVRS